MNVVAPSDGFRAVIDKQTSQSGPPPRGRILLIDDDSQIRLVFRKFLERRGYQVFEAAAGREGLAATEREFPDLILLDLNLPVMTGLETLGQITQRCPDIPVIIVSGSGRMNDAIEALKAGATDYLIKPLPDQSALTHTVETNLERARLTRQNRAIRQELELHHEQLREDEEAGRKVQARLFPPTDWSVGGYRFQHCVITSLVLSGDFVDYFSVNDRCAAFCGVDVSGHGISSALVTVLRKSLITKYREHLADRQDRLILEPARLLERLNKDLLQENLGKHLTMFYGVVDLKAHTLCYTCGGHYPPALLFSNGQIPPLEQRGMAVGLFPGNGFESQTVSLPETFRLLVFSDGALDALPLSRPEARIEFLRTLTTSAALRAFVDQAGANKHLPDDFTVLSVSRGELP